MAVPSGLGSQIGFAEEVTFGTAVTPDRFFEYNSESLKYDKEHIASAGLLAGSRFQRRWVAGREGVAGDVEFEILPNGFGLLSKYMLGAVATTTPAGATNARLQTATVGDMDDKSLTCQVGRPNIDGTVDPYTYSGCKVAQWELSLEANGVAMIKLTLDGQKEVTTTSLATADYPDENFLLSWADANAYIKINDVEYNINKITLTGDNSLKTDRYAIGSPYKLKQIEGAALRAYGGTIDLEAYAGLTPYNLFKDGTEVEVHALFSGAEIESGFNYSVDVTITKVRFDGDTPNVAGPDVLAQSMPFVVLDPLDGNSPITIETQNTDTTA